MLYYVLLYKQNGISDTVSVHGTILREMRGSRYEIILAWLKFPHQVGFEPVGQLSHLHTYTVIANSLK